MAFFPQQIKVDKNEILFSAAFFCFPSFTFSFFFFYKKLGTSNVSGHMAQENFGVSLPLWEVLTTVFENLCASSKQQHNR